MSENRMPAVLFTGLFFILCSVTAFLYGGTPAVTLTPSALTFATQSIGAITHKRVGLKNTGTDTLNISSIVASGSDFSIYNTCGRRLGPGYSCDVWVYFKPTQPGPRSGSLSITSNVPSSPTVVALSGVGSGTPPPPSVSISISPTAATVQANGLRQFSATVSNASSSAVTWLASGDGSITQSGLFTAGSIAGNATVTVTSVQNATKSASASITVTVPPLPPLPVTVSVTPTSATIAANGNQQFTATVSNASNTSVRWTAAGDGGVTALGLFTAGSIAGNARITATSVQDSTKSATALITVTAPPPPLPISVAIAPTAVTTTPNGSQQFAAIVNNASNPAVAWTATGDGSVSASGLFTAGSVAGAATVTATSVQDSARSATANITVTALPPPPPSGARHYLYIAGTGGAVHVHDINNGHALVQTINLPQLTSSAPPWGMAACVGNGIMYISYGGLGGRQGNGSLLAYDLVHNQLLWTKSYSHGVDSFAVTPDCSTIYMPDGENSGDGTWYILSTSDGHEAGTIAFGLNPHNTLMSLNGAHAYFGPRNFNYLGQVSTSSNTVTKQIGPMIQTNIASGNGVRPFTVDGRERYAFTTESGFLGFQVSDINTGNVLWTLQPSGFTQNNTQSAPSHGISLSPTDEHELYFINWPNYVHVYDVSNLPAEPTKTFDIRLVHPLGCIGWLSHSRDGRYVYVGCSGDVIDTSTHSLLTGLPLQNDLASYRYYIEVDWAGGVPVFAMSSRMGQGYVTSSGPPPPPAGTATLPLFYTDLDSGPATGEQNNQGVFVSIYGNGFGDAVLRRAAPVVRVVNIATFAADDLVNDLLGRAHPPTCPPPSLPPTGAARRGKGCPRL